MANYANLKATIAANIYTNGNNEVTAAMVKATVDAVVNSLGAGWQYMGIATPAGAGPGATDNKVAYIATTPGTYTNFGGLVVADGEVAILKYDGSWSKEVTGAATAAQVSQLREKVGDFDAALNLPYSTPTGSRYVYWSTGALTQSGVCSAITDVDVSAYVGKTLYYSRARIPAAQGNQGMAFMKADGTFLFGAQGILNASEWGIELSSITIPTGAAKARFTCPTDELANFQCYVEQTIAERLNEIEAADLDWMVKGEEYIANGNAVQDDLGFIVSQDILWVNGYTGTLTRSNFNDSVFEYEREVLTCSNGQGVSLTATIDKTFDQMGNIVKKEISITA